MRFCFCSWIGAFDPLKANLFNEIIKHYTKINSAEFNEKNIETKQHKTIVLLSGWFILFKHTKHISTSEIRTHLTNFFLLKNSAGLYTQNTANFVTYVK